LEYTVNKLAKLSGISARTLRFYDEIGLLKPAKVNESGYRIYEQKEVDFLQQILFYRELGISLEEIKVIVKDPGFDVLKALQGHYERLLMEKDRLNKLISNVEKTIKNAKGEIDMSDNEKFEGFKQKMIDENEQKYGKEAREKYGDESVERSNQKIKNMTKQQSDELEALGKEVIEVLLEAYETGDPKSEKALKAAELHKKWLMFFWEQYDKKAHAALAKMYVNDPRFTQYYDKYKPGLTLFLKDAILNFTGEME